MDPRERLLYRYGIRRATRIITQTAAGSPDSYRMGRTVLT
jgi:hypothetical protein